MKVNEAAVQYIYSVNWDGRLMECNRCNIKVWMVCITYESFIIVL